MQRMLEYRLSTGALAPKIALTRLEDGQPESARRPLSSLATS
jgi:hypothetical protein